MQKKLQILRMFTPNFRILEPRDTPLIGTNVSMFRDFGHENWLENCRTFQTKKQFCPELW